jgi:hypothetical protein
MGGGESGAVSASTPSCGNARRISGGAAIRFLSAQNGESSADILPRMDSSGHKAVITAASPEILRASPQDLIDATSKQHLLSDENRVQRGAAAEIIADGPDPEAATD